MDKMDNDTLVKHLGLKPWETTNHWIPQVSYPHTYLFLIESLLLDSIQRIADARPFSINYFRFEKDNRAKTATIVLRFARRGKALKNTSILFGGV